MYSNLSHYFNMIVVQSGPFHVQVYVGLRGGVLIIHVITIIIVN